MAHSLKILILTAFIKLSLANIAFSEDLKNDFNSWLLSYKEFAIKM